MQSALDKEAYDAYYEDLSVTSDANLVEVLGFHLKKRKNITDVKSDFQIHSSVCKDAKLPLVLPVDMYTKRLRYTIDVWDKDTKVPYNDSRSLSERSLPDDGTKYPYLTIGDFLEDYILWDENTFNQEDFFNGGTDVEGCYLLPLRKEFFSYFTVEELQGTMPDGKKMFELVRNAGGVKAILRVPVQKNEYITYERLYFADAMAEPQNNKGGIIKRTFGVALFPLVKFVGNEKMEVKKKFLWNFIKVVSSFLLKERQTEMWLILTMHLMKLISLIRILILCLLLMKEVAEVASYRCGTRKVAITNNSLLL